MNYDTASKAVKLRAFNMEAVSRHMIHEILSTDLFLPSSKKAELEINLSESLRFSYKSTLSHHKVTSKVLSACSVADKMTMTIARPFN